MNRIERPRMLAAMLSACAFVCLGYGVFLLTGSAFLLYVAAGCLTAVTAFHALSSIFLGSFNVGSLMASQTLLWYAVPFSYIGFVDYDAYMAPYTHVSFPAAVPVLFEITLCAGVTLVLSELFGVVIRLRNFELDMGRVAALVLPVLAIQFVLVVTGEWGYANVSGASEDAHFDTPLIMATRDFASVVPPVVAICLASFLAGNPRLRRHSLSVIAFMGVAFVTQVMWWTVSGRRPMTIVFAISALSFFAIYFRGRMTPRRLLALALLGIAAAPLVWYLWEAYYTLRIATNWIANSGNLSIMDVFEARQWVASTSRDNGFLANVVVRPFMLITSVAIFQETASGLLNGWSLLSQALLAIPSVFWPGKLDAIGPTAEWLWADSLGVPLTDWSITLFLDGYSDFGYLGFPIIVLIVSLMAKASDWAAERIGQPANAFQFFILAFFILNIESNYATIFVGFRDIAMIFVAALGLRIIVGRRKARRAARSRGLRPAFTRRPPARLYPGAPNGSAAPSP